MMDDPGRDVRSVHIHLRKSAPKGIIVVVGRLRGPIVRRMLPPSQRLPVFALEMTDIMRDHIELSLAN